VRFSLKRQAQAARRVQSVPSYVSYRADPIGSLRTML
jgi:hypothetical protein